MSISLQADSTLPQGYILVDGQRAATISTTGLSATLAANTVTTSALVSGAVTTEKIALGAVITADLADGAVTAAKMSGGQSGSAPVYGCRAWVNFNGATLDNSPLNAPPTTTISVSAGNTFGHWDSVGWSTDFVGVRYKISSINGVTGALLGGVDVANAGIQIVEFISSSRVRFRFLSGQTPTSNQSQVGNNTSGAGGFTYQALGIREAGNVSSVFKNGTGDYTVNFTTPMPDTFYSAVLTNRSTYYAGVAYSTTCAIADLDTALSLSSVRIIHTPAADVGGYAGAVNDTAIMCVSIFR